jgi:hypothetical protein
MLPWLQQSCCTYLWPEAHLQHGRSLCLLQLHQLLLCLPAAPAALNHCSRRLLLQTLLSTCPAAHSVEQHGSCLWMIGGKPALEASQLAGGNQYHHNEQQVPLGQAAFLLLQQQLQQLSAGSTCQGLCMAAATGVRLWLLPLLVVRLTIALARLQLNLLQAPAHALLLSEGHQAGWH